VTARRKLATRIRLSRLAAAARSLLRLPKKAKRTDIALLVAACASCAFYLLHSFAVRRWIGEVIAVVNRRL
jgi:hypothetical protein